ATLTLATVVQAGPPLICHTIEIGQSKSLPWISHNWNLSGGETYDTKNLVRDTLEILAPDTPILVRMETLRRATLYTRKDPVVVKKALTLRASALHGDDSQMEFAAALITLSGPQAEHREHAQKAISGAKTDPLLAQNLATRFLGPQTETVAQLLAKN